MYRNINIYYGGIYTMRDELTKIPIYTIYQVMGVKTTSSILFLGMLIMKYNSLRIYTVNVVVWYKGPEV